MSDLQVTMIIKLSLSRSLRDILVSFTVGLKDQYLCIIVLYMLASHRMKIIIQYCILKRLSG